MFNQKRYEQIESIIICNAVGLITLTTTELFSLCFELDLMITEKYKFLEGENIV